MRAAPLGVSGLASSDFPPPLRPHFWSCRTWVWGAFSVPGTCGLPGGGEYTWLVSGLALSPKEGEKGSQEEFCVPDPRTSAQTRWAPAPVHSAGLQCVLEEGGATRGPLSPSAHP